MGDILADLFSESEYGSSPEDLFRMLETLEEGSIKDDAFFKANKSTLLIRQKDGFETVRKEMAPTVGKKRKRSATLGSLDGQGSPTKMSHITVERNRRKQMNEHLCVLRSLMPCFYVKRGDQASIIGGVVDYIKELQQLLQSLEAKKQRKVYSDVLSPRPAISPRLPLSPKPHPLSPRVGFPISPRTPQPGSPYKPRLTPAYIPNAITVPTNESCPSLESVIHGSSVDFGTVSSRAPATPEVKVEFSGPNVLLKTVSQCIPGQLVKIIAALERLSLEVLHANISTVDDTMLNSFTIKVYRQLFLQHSLPSYISY
ncbi:basic helix-loop-helix (bHLH) DNA-binding superfamily protein [Rhynchospora pubera]|uniref:Basic helix-loop-helix (BHLH) DNA-binding superfamily protein n=1 Tax=Rhynchospora pubera TaxID=906938 RepID=A0AAV8DV32_9POAL|nr:basic helix-loop-helix (bHLH) DNA-binding superfamily protein [Rhynchospora pubera]